MGARGARRARARSRVSVRLVAPTAVPARARAAPSRRRARRSCSTRRSTNESSRGRTLRLGPPLRRRAAVPRGRLPARDAGAHDRDVPELWEPTRRGSSPASASRGPSPGCGPAGTRRPSATSLGRRTGSHDDVYLTDLDGGWVAGRRTRGSALRSGSTGTPRCSAGSSLAAVRRRASPASRGVVRARHRAVDEQAQPRAGRRRRRGDEARRTKLVLDDRSGLDRQPLRIPVRGRIG